ncbi:hypothetical protein ASPWEDRAFT_105059 [Aspergillus wentii DTO 134E9]|uniref:ABC transporter n=1 Tax=Aspergillus wentii DTO 134E9 TaxID=1073089 RepID=A0A1L9RTT4_ASPWE|nr:uncharacterized protein ASPWEDRAFT_105059 [Aspergillus wentii DTO 134E9]OJJ38335.1 hypothetical protein ASPWEDRAFT_105059 [Aspergillus wentii DTO 134E9]
MSSQEFLLRDIQPAVSPCAAEVIESQIHTESSTANFFSLYRYANASQICTLFVSACCAIAAGAAMPLVTVAFGTLADGFINGHDQSHNIQDQTQHLTLRLVYIAIGSFVTTMVSTWGFNVVGEQIASQLQQKYLSAVLQQNMAYFDIVGTGELTSYMDQDMKLIQEGISHKVGDLLSGISGFVVAITCAFMQNRRFAAIMISQPIALILLVGLMGYWLSVTQRMGLAQYVQADNLAQEVLGAMRNVIAYRSQKRYAKKYHDSLRHPAALDFQERLIFGVIVAGSFTILHWTNGLGLWQGDRLYREGLCNISEILTILYATAVAGGMLCQALPCVVDITQANGAASRVFSVIERTSPINPLAGTGRKYDRVHGDIQFDEVIFAYPARPEQTVLDGVSLHVPPGHTVALVGPSGSGKSTVFGLLERLYLPLSGRITLDGEPIDELNISWLRSQIGYVSQDVTLFQASIHTNIAFGLSTAATKNLDAPTIRRLVIQAAETAQIHAFIMDLPQGYDTVITANGSSLSGGQRQRLAIARAIVSQPSILLLDEATAALDSQCEKEVQEALTEAVAGRTTIIIAHRLSTIQNADTIVVIKDGQIQDQGSHAELMATSTMYQELVKQQALQSNDQSEDGIISQSPSPAIHPREFSQNISTNDEVRSMPEDYPQRKSSIKYVWHLNNPELPYTTAGVVFSILVGVTYPIQAIFFGNGIISIIRPSLSTGDNNVLFWARMYLIHGIVVFVVYCVRGYCFAVSASQLNLRARSHLFRTLLMKNLGFFEDKDHSTGSLVSFLSSGTPKITGVSGTSLGLMAESLVMLATGITVGCIFGWKLGLAATAAVPFVAVSGFLQYYIVAQIHKYVKRDTNAVAVAHEAFSAIKTVTVLGLQNIISESFQRESGRDSQGGYWVMSATMYACTTLFRILSIAFVFWYGGTHLIATGEYNIQQFFICFAATIWGSQSAAALFAHAPDIAGAHAAAVRLENLMKTGDSKFPGKIYSHDHSVSVSSTAEDLELRHVNFQYPSHPSRLTLNDVSLNATAGSFIALVGATGSGKSSVINLIERFYAPASGRITLEDLSIEQYDLDSYRGYLALVDQNPCLVGQDLRECLQSDERVVSDDDILIALKSVGLVDFVLSLPQGLYTPTIGNGSTLSGGQRQRMAIAKALLWRPWILLLDEATSALDTASEKIVQEALRDAMKGRTTIAVAHRLKTIADADEILVFDRGQIIERGTHDELMQAGGKYWQMAKLQQLNEEG